VGAEPVLLITGASSGIGAATARAAVQAGHRVVLAARREQRLQQLCEELGGSRRALAVPGDVTEWDDQRRFVASAVEHFGKVDAVMANAGMSGRRSFLADDVEQWRAMVLTNVLGVALTVRAALPHMLERGTGDFLITSSVGGRRVMGGSLYSATKHAVTAIGLGLRAELRQQHGNRRIRVTILEPGMTETEIFDNRPELRPEAMIRPQDVARAAMYALAQPADVELNEVMVLATSQDR
jgi:NADP-dependent 3-hydroxy acid dehydrogenase YdfG